MIGAISDHLWQSTLFVLAAAAVAAALRQNGAHIRHRIWLIASIKFLVPLSVLMSLGAMLPRIAPAAPAPITTEVPDFSIAVDFLAQPFTSDALVSNGPAAAAGTNWVPWLIAGMWAGGFVAVLGMRVRGWQRVRAALRASTAVPITAPVPVRSSPGLLEPGVVGLWRPVLLVPAGIEQQLTPRQFEAVLLHEWCHVQRRDNLTSVIHMVVEAVFWFHPLVWFVGARLVEERERACDEFVLRTAGDPAAYAESILNVCKLYVESPVACVSGVTGADLKKRIAAILSNRTGRQLNLARRIALVAVAVLAVTLPLAAGMVTASLRVSTFAADQPAASAFAPAQGATADKPKFDVVSVKPCESSTPGASRSGGGPPITSPGRLYLQCYRVSSLIREAYLFFADGRAHATSSVIGVDVEGEPSWFASERFLIEAKTAQVVPAAVMRGPMLQAILEDRFKLKIRRVSREMPVYELVAAKSGAKVAPYTGTDCVIKDDAAWPPPAPPEGQRYCGDQSRREGDRFVRTGVMRLDDLASLFPFDRPVVNRTGITAHVSYRLDLATEDMMMGQPPTASFINALRNQLGLELRESKGPRDVLVIDHVERPTPDAPSPEAHLTRGSGEAGSFPSLAEGPTRSEQAGRKFDVASVKPCEGSAPEFGSRRGRAGQQASPGYLHLSCLTLRQLLLMAHAGPDNRLLNRKWEEQFVEGFPPFVKGGPSWAYSDRWTIEAKAEGVTSRDVLTGPMLRALLADRFQLKIHRDAEERAMLALTVAKAGLKIQPVPPGSCFEYDPANPPAPGTMNGKSSCGISTGDGWGSSELIGVTLGEAGRDGERFTDYLWRALRQPVLDRTSLTGRYTFKLEFTPDETTPGVNGRCGGTPDCMGPGISDARPATFRNSANLFKALEELGLKLEKIRAPAGFIVIDHAERPAPNVPTPSQAGRPR